MALSKLAFNRIIVASAYSESPLDEEVLREIAADRGDDPDVIIQRHQEIRDGWESEKRDRSGPMPIIVP